MSDTIEIRAEGNHGNIEATRSGRDGTSGSHVFVGVTGGKVPPEVMPASTPVDVTPYSTLRVALNVVSMTNREGDEQGLPDAARLYVELDHGPTASGPWSLLHRFEPMNARGEQRKVLSGFDNFVRARHHYRRSSDEDTILSGVQYVFSVIGQAEPEQP